MAPDEERFPTFEPRKQPPPKSAPPEDPPLSLARMSPPISPHSERKRRRRRRSIIPHSVRRLMRLVPWQVVLVVILLVVIVPTATVAVFAADSYARVQESLGSLQRVVETIGNRTFTAITLEDFDKLQASVKNFANTLIRAQQQTTLLRNFASANPDLETVLEMLDAAQPLALAAQTMLEGAQPALTFLVKGQKEGSISAQISSGERLIELLQVGQSRFRTAETLLAQASEAIEKIDLSKVARQRLGDYELIVSYHAQLDRINRILRQTPDFIAGAFALDLPQNYLILSQNNDELRPSGGYISTYGWMRVRRFRILDYDYSPTTQLSPNPPPAEMVKELNVPSWWFQSRYPIMAAWSGSWFADFPSTARMAAWYYDNGQNPRSPVNGVLAVDLTGFQLLLEGLGEIKIEKYNVAINAKNFREVIYQIRADNEADHKAFLTEVYREILRQWQELSQERSIPLLNTAIRALQTKHIMIYFTDPYLNEMVNLLGWSGAQSAGNDDYLMIVDANMGNKSNSSVTRDISYSVVLQPDGTLSSRAVIDYTYSAQVAAKDPAVAPAHYGNQKDYYSLFQVYTPVGTKLVRAENLQAPVQVDERAQHTLFATGMRVKFDSNERFEFEYTVPLGIKTFGPYRRYHLLIQKQPGTQSERVYVQVRLPAGTQVISTSPVPADSFTLDNPILEFQLNLDTDREIDILFSQ